MKKKILLFILVVLSALLIGFAVLFILFFMKSNTNQSNNDWVILSSEENLESAKVLQKAIKDTKVVNAEVVTDKPEIWEGRLILVGETTETTSKKAILSLEENGFLVEFGKEYIVITGSTKEKTLEAVNYVCETYMSYLEEYHDLPFGSEFNYVSYGTESGKAPKQIFLNGVAIRNYQIVATDGKKNEAAEFLQNAIKNIVGLELEIVNEQVSDGYGIEILSEGNGLAKELKSQQFRIYQNGTKLYLCAGDKEQELLVVKMLLTKYFAYDYLEANTTEYAIEMDDVDFKFTCNWEEFTAPKAVQSKVLMIEEKNGYHVLQGGCTDGTYGYYVVNNTAHSPWIDCIYKVDLKTMKVVAAKEGVELQHANSITYNSKLKKIVCANYDPDKTTITFVDPKTLSITGTTEVQFNVLSIAYNVERNEYVAGTRGTFDFFELDGNLKIQDCHEAIQTSSTKQEVEIYKDKIIFGMSGPNVLYVYNWDGKFQYSVELGMETEFENLIFNGDVAYVGYNVRGGAFYETIFYQEMK